MSNPQLSAEQEQQVKKLINELVTYRPIGRESYDEAPVYRGQRLKALEDFGRPVIPYLFPFFKDKSYQDVVKRLGGPEAEDVIAFLQTPGDNEAKFNLMLYLIENKGKYQKSSSLLASLAQIARTDIPTNDPNEEALMLNQIVANKVLAEFGDLSVKNKLAQLLDEVLTRWGQPDDKEGLLKVSTGHQLYRQCTDALGTCQATDVLLAQLKLVERYTRSYVLWGLQKIEDPKLFNTYLEMVDREFALGISRTQTTFSSLLRHIEDSAVSTKEKEKALKAIQQRAKKEAPDALKAIERSLEAVTKNKKGFLGLW